MFDGLSTRLGDVFDKLRRRGSLSESDVNAALREVRIALLEADVALPVVKDFVDRVRTRAVGQEVLKSVTPGQQVIKIVHDNLVEMLGGGEDSSGSATATADPATSTPSAKPPAPTKPAALPGLGSQSTPSTPAPSTPATATAAVAKPALPGLGAPAAPAAPEKKKGLFGGFGFGKGKAPTPGPDVIPPAAPAALNPAAAQQAPRISDRAASENELYLNATPPIPYLMVGLQGSGKTTSSAKIAYRLRTKHNKKVLMASLDVRRPAAQEQLAVLGQQTEVATLPIVPNQDPLRIAKRAMETGRLEGYDVVILDTAGRLAIDEELMAEVMAVRDAVKPVETLLVADAMTGQDAVTVAQTFNERVGLTGIVLTRVDGDARGGAALSMRAITGRPIKLLGVGEKFDALETFHPDRIANRILGMGDVVSLVERAAESMEEAEAERLAKKMRKGGFDMNDLLSQLRQMRKMGGLKGLMGMLPGAAKMKEQMAAANMDDGIIKRQEAIICSMTKGERENPKVIHAKRKVRIANGSGTTVQDVNKLLKQFQQMNDMMKKARQMEKKYGKKGPPGGLGGLLPPGMMPPPGMR